MQACIMDCWCQLGLACARGGYSGAWGLGDVEAWKVPAAESAAAAAAMVSARRAVL